MIDKIFKIGLLLIGIVFVTTFYWSSQNGRYQKNPSGLTVFDSRTGAFYAADSSHSKIITYDLISGKTIVYDSQYSDRSSFRETANKEAATPAPPGAPIR